MFNFEGLGKECLFITIQYLDLISITNLSLISKTYKAYLEEDFIWKFNLHFHFHFSINLENKITNRKLIYQLFFLIKKINAEKLNQIKLDLLNHNSLNNSDNDGMTILMWASQEGHTKIAQTLIQIGV